jgi:hypothetical protein
MFNKSDKITFFQIKNGIKKGEFSAHFRSIEKAKKMTPKKRVNMSKRVKSANNFILVHFLQTFSKGLNQRKDLHLLINILIF